MTGKKRCCLALCAAFLCYSAPSAVSLPMSKEQLFQLATIAASTDKFDEAQDLFKKVLEIDPKFAPAYNGLGLINQTFSQGNIDEAIRYFTLATNFAPDFYEGWNNLGRVCYTRGRFKDAEQAFLKSLQLKSDQQDISFSLGWVYLLGQSRPEKALESFDAVGESFGNNSIYYGRGLAHMMLGERFKVLDDITQLRKVGQETQADRLEKMVRENVRLNSTPGTPLVAGLPDEVSAFDEQLKALEAKGFTGSSVDGIKVRLKGPLPVN